MSLYAFGLTHESALLEVRDAFAFDGAAVRRFYDALDLPAAVEVVLLSTCNRTEVYLNGTTDDVGYLQRLLGSLAGRAWPQEASFLLEDEAAVRHVLHVAGGLRSLVLGDGQILSQVKDAYRVAVEAGRVGTVLHRLMHVGFRAAKRIASETSLGNGAVSVSSAAIAMARAHFECQGHHDLEGVRVLLVGAGQMARLAFQVIERFAPAEIAMTNRTSERARTITAAVPGARAIPWEARHEAVREADLVIVATAAPQPVVTPAGLGDLPPVRHGVLLIDLSAPRNVDTGVERIPGYSVRDMDALRAWIRQAEDARREEVPSAEAICEELLAEFVSWMFHQQALQPAVQALHDTFEQIRQQEIARHHHRFSDADRAQLDLLTRSIVQKVLAIPIVRLKDTHPETLDFVRSVQLLQGLFARPLCEEDGVAAAGAQAALSALAESIVRREPETDRTPEALAPALPNAGVAVAGA